MVVQEGGKRTLPWWLEQLTSEESGLIPKVDDVWAVDGGFCSRCARNQKQIKGKREGQQFHGLD